MQQQQQYHYPYNNKNNPYNTYNNKNKKSTFLGTNLICRSDSDRQALLYDTGFYFSETFGNDFFDDSILVPEVL